MKTAIVVTNPDGQTVRLPLRIHLEGDEVLVKQVGTSVVLVPKQANPWQSLLESLDQFSDDYLDQRSQPPVQTREAIFE